MARVLITDGEQRSALAVVRSLGRAGHELGVVSTRGRGLAGWSRWVRRWSAAPSPLERPSAFVNCVRDRVREWKPDLVLPMTEGAVHALLPCRESLAPARIPLPSREKFYRATAKDEVAEHAASVGIRVPRQLVLEGPDGMLPGKNDLRYPLAVKATRSISNGDGVRVKTGTAYAEAPEDLPEIVGRYPEASFPLLLQERISGPGVGIFLLLWHGEVRARFAHRRIREKPPSGGVSVLRRSIDVPEVWFQRAEELLRRLEWCGVGMVELKIDTASGEPYLMEVNPRFWGSLQLAIDSGVDFPALLVALSLGENPPPQTIYRTGVRTRWFWGDVDHLLARLRTSVADLNLSPDAPGRVAAIADFVRGFSPGVRNEVFRWRDPLPAMAETLNWFRGR